MGDGDYFREEEAPGIEADYSTPCRAVVKKYGLQRDLPLSLLANTVDDLLTAISKFHVRGFGSSLCLYFI
jgi:hypothetical protein